jgi:hypothetical protein
VGLLSGSNVGTVTDPRHESPPDKRKRRLRGPRHL